ncbi:unnamed protein product [Clonostachys rhizophaga]|uniref:Ubiquitin carboxyl-terminal hydrolase n=1 Tax=Clonostachys rhizophaga TaxID=160324 RepID=A0A9N9YIR0_9HYPO|nr:unnamed protein product [Clonostachys rhizophaga]
MAAFFNKIKGASTASGNPTVKENAAAKKRDEQIILEMTPLEKMLRNAGPLREDGSDRFYGFENFGNTCYCNSIVQALFYSDLFRNSVINYPSLSPSDTPDGTRPRVNVSIRPPMQPTPPNPPNGKQKGLSSSQVIKQRQAINAGMPPPGQGPVRPEDKPDTPEYKKKQAMLKGPILELAQENTNAYGMDECTFTGLKDIFLALIESQTRTGVLSPQRFLEIFKRDNEMFRNSMHQDAHEFYGLVLNDVIANVEANAHKFKAQLGTQENGLAQSVENALGSAMAKHINGVTTPGTGWVHDIFEGVLTSETKCLTCETGSQRDETFLDLSIDLEEHSSVTSCLRKFSDEEMLCERNKFHCDHCGGLQEAEKRMKVKRLPKVLTLHLKRFKYTEDYSRLQKLFHRVVYPYHLRMFNTTDEAEDPDRLYELYAVVVHIGGNAYHGHYVSIIKTQDRGWVLFDDEMVEPVDKHFVRNFFGEKPGMATAYVLFYQETTFEKVREEQEREGMEDIKLASQAASSAQEDDDKSPKASTQLKRQATFSQRATVDHEELGKLARTNTSPEHALSSPPIPALANPPIPEVPVTTTNSTSEPTEVVKSKEDKKREKKEREAAEKAEKQAERAEKLAEKEREKQAKLEEKKRQEERIKNLQQARKSESDELQKALEESKKLAKEENAKKRESGSSSPFGLLDRSKRGSKSMAKRSFSFFHREKGDNSHFGNSETNGEHSEGKDSLKDRLSSSLGRKKSTNILA